MQIPRGILLRTLNLSNGYFLEISKQSGIDSQTMMTEEDHLKIIASNLSNREDIRSKILSNKISRFISEKMDKKVVL